MSYYKKEDEYYIQLITEFCDKIEKYYMQIELPSLFIPFVSEKYYRSGLKIFYINEATNGCGSINDLIIQYKLGSLEEYLARRRDWFSDYEFFNKLIESSQNFWFTAIKIHLKLKKVNPKIIKDIIPFDIYNEYLNDFGWGNLHSIETVKTLDKKRAWMYINKEIYRDIKNKSEQIDPIINILKVFEPNLVIILNSDVNEKIVFKGLDYKSEFYKYDDFNFNVYKPKSHDSHIIWIKHSHGAGQLRRNSTVLSDLVYLLCEKYQVKI